MNGRNRDVDKKCAFILSTLEGDVEPPISLDVLRDHHQIKVAPGRLCVREHKVLSDPRMFEDGRE